MWCAYFKRNAREVLGPSQRCVCVCISTSKHVEYVDINIAPDFFERYGEAFDPQLGMGDVEVWIPVIE